MPDPVTARKAVGTAVPVISTTTAAPAPAQSLAERFPPTVPKVDEFSGMGGTYQADPVTGVRVRIDEPEVLTVTGDGTGQALPPFDPAAERTAAPVLPEAVIPAADGTNPAA